MRRALGIASAVFIATSATAQDAPFDPVLPETCLAAGKAAACIGLGAELCMAGEAGSSNVGIGGCFAAELRWWDDELNRVYAAMIDLYGTRDAELRDLGSAAPPSVPALRAAQRAWIGWRDGYCAFEATTWGGGSGSGIAETQCRMQLTGEQALRLDARLAESGG